MNSFFRKITWLTRRPSKDAELREELEFHLQEEAGQRHAQGLTIEEAHRAARRELGNVTLVQEETRAAWSWTLWEQLLQDIRYAWRTMSANRSFTALAVLSLALGIGANTAIFSFLDSILLRSLPVPDPQSLVLLNWHTPHANTHGMNLHDDSYDDPNGGFIGGFFSYPAFELLQKSESVFSSVFGYQGAGKLNLTFRGQAELAGTEYVSADYFRSLGTQPAAGRLIGPEDDRSGAPPIAVISYGLSERRFGGPDNAPGQSMFINNLPFTVAGVAPREFYGADPDIAPDIYLPMHAIMRINAETRYVPNDLFIDSTFDWVNVMARLRPGVSASQAQAALAASFYQWGRATKPQLAPADIPTLRVQEGSAGLDSLRRRYTKPLYILLTLVTLILAIACANIANLLLSRAAARKREIAVRLSVGAGRPRVIRQLLTESVLLAGLGGALGVAFALWGIRFLTLLIASGRENFTLRAELNWHVLSVVAGLSLLTGILFGLAPALQSTRFDLISALKESRTGETRWRGFRRLSLSRVLMASQMAITLLILVAAGLFARTLSNLSSIELGFNREDVLTFQLNARQAGHKEPGIVALYSDLQRQIRAVPGVHAVSLSNHTMIGTGTTGLMVGLPGGASRGSRILSIGADFFRTMEIPILLGRAIDDRDQSGAPMVAVVNQEFAKMSFGDRNPLGQHLTLPRACPTCNIEIVGVSANPFYGDLKRKAPPIVYLSFAQGELGPIRQMYYEVRTARNPLSYVHAIRDLVRRADDRLPLSEVKTMSAWIDQSINQEIVFARLCGAFALLALAIAGVGLYGTMSYNVARRTSEIGIRIALGAQRTRVTQLVLREMSLLVIVGLAISLPTALAMSKVVESFLFGMKPNDPLALSGAVATLVIAAILAGYIPARRASRIDPMTALRHE
jgi:predicted permease